MGRKSSIDNLPEPIRNEALAAVKRGATIDEIVWTLKGLGADVSRSAVGRFSKEYRDLAARQRDLQSIAKSFGADFGQADDLQGRLLIQLLTSIATRMVMPIAAGDEVTPDGKELHFYARALKDIISASKTDVDREAKIRAEGAKRAREAAAADAEAAGKAAGASPETIDRIKRRILGIDDSAKGAAA